MFTHRDEEPAAVDAVEARQVEVGVVGEPLALPHLPRRPGRDRSFIRSASEVITAFLHIEIIKKEEKVCVCVYIYI